MYKSAVNRDTTSFSELEARFENMKKKKYSAKLFSIISNLLGKVK